MKGTRHLVRSLPLSGEELVGVIKVDARMNVRSIRDHSFKRMLNCVSDTSILTFSQTLTASTAVYQIS